jgi:hypothetical protein
MANKTNKKYKEVLDLIKFCSKQGVSKITCEGVSVEFFENGLSGENRPIIVDALRKQTEINKNALEKETVREKMDRINNMIIENPVEFERLVAEGELTEDIGVIEDGNEEA